MNKPVLLVTRHLPAAVEARAAGAFAVWINPAEAPCPPAEILRRSAGASAILCVPGDRIDADLIRQLPGSIRVIATFSVGYDHIDVGAAQARGIAVCHTPDVLSTATAELAMALLLGAARRLGEGERMVRAGQWSGWAPTQLLGIQVSGRRLGIFGFGRIGRALARIAHCGFGMEIHYRDRLRLPPQLEAEARFHDSDDTFLPVCEMLSLHAPATADTRKWLNAERIAKLPRGAVVVNAARGALVDDEALIAALQSRRLGFAGLDVYEDEPNLHPGYRELDNVVLLPHLGSATVETREAMGFLALDGITAALAGRKPANLVA